MKSLQELKESLSPDRLNIAIDVLTDFQNAMHEIGSTQGLQTKEHQQIVIAGAQCLISCTYLIKLAQGITREKKDFALALKEAAVTSSNENAHHPSH